jgi:hypothetical protein
MLTDRIKRITLIDKAINVAEGIMISAIMLALINAIIVLVLIFLNTGNIKLAIVVVIALVGVMVLCNIFIYFAKSYNMALCNAWLP